MLVSLPGAGGEGSPVPGTAEEGGCRVPRAVSQPSAPSRLSTEGRRCSRSSGRIREIRRARRLRPRSSSVRRAAAPGREAHRRLFPSSEPLGGRAVFPSTASTLPANRVPPPLPDSRRCRRGVAAPPGRRGRPSRPPGAPPPARRTRRPAPAARTRPPPWLSRSPPSRPAPPRPPARPRERSTTARAEKGVYCSGTASGRSAAVTSTRRRERHRTGIELKRERFIPCYDNVLPKAGIASLLLEAQKGGGVEGALEALRPLPGAGLHPPGRAARGPGQPGLLHFRRSSFGKIKSGGAKKLVCISLKNELQNANSCQLTTRTKNLQISVEGDGSIRVTLSSLNSPEKKKKQQKIMTTIQQAN